MKHLQALAGFCIVLFLGRAGLFAAKTPGLARIANTVGDAITLGWLEFFQHETERLKR